MFRLTQDRPEVDYSKARDRVLRRLAAGGDHAAEAELARRAADGVVQAAGVDVTKLTYMELANLRHAWRDGSSRDEVARSFAIAEAAHQEMHVRRVVLARIGWRSSDASVFGPPLDGQDLPGIAPWNVPLPPRCISWRRPTGSTLYPSDEDRQRARFAALAQQFYCSRRAAGGRDA
jgi:hypothetical protein